MATQILSTTEAVEFRNTNPRGPLPFGELSRVFHIDPQTHFPVQPASWVMATQQLADLVEAGIVTVGN